MQNPIYTDGVTLLGDGTIPKVVQAQSGLRKATVTLTVAQLLALFSTPVTLVPAPGAGLVIVPIAAYVKYSFVTTQYVSASQNLLVEYGAAAGVNAFSALAIQTTLQSATSRQILMSTIGGVTVAAASSINKAITARLSVSNPTNGDGLLTISVYYDIVPQS